MVTEKPLATRSFAMEEEMIPFPSDEVTPPVTKMYFVVDMKDKVDILTPAKVHELFKMGTISAEQSWIFFLSLLDDEYDV